MVDVETVAMGILFVFIGIIAFMIGTTVLQSTMPVLNTMQNSTPIFNNSSYFNQTGYIGQRDMIWTAANIGMYIILGTVFLYLAMRLLFRREPTSESYGGYTG
jgi:membrane protein implicated in regulation of membrane protease activity